jgi:tRNA A-37 threonylcarbamoyl transferase component Bud32
VPPAGDEQPTFVASSTTDSTLDVPVKPGLGSDKTVEVPPTDTDGPSTMFELVGTGTDPTIEVAPEAEFSTGQWSSVDDPGRGNDPSTVVAPSDSAVGRGRRRTMDSSETKVRPGAVKPAAGDAIPQVAGYEILGVLGRGGMGVVYKARQRGLNRLVALKMILGGAHAGAGERGRFQTEALAVAKLQHANIVQVYEVGEHDGQPFFSMDLVEGQNLAQLVRNEPLPSRKAAVYLKTIAEAVQYAHSHGVLHRDLKPSNILIDDSDQPRVTDFGLAKRLSDPVGTRSTASHYFWQSQGRSGIRPYRRCFECSANPFTN